MPDAIRAHFIDAYTGRDALRCAFAHYRATPTTVCQIRRAAASGRLAVPTTIVGARPVGNALERQVRPLMADPSDLTGHPIEDSGHIIPLDRPERLVDLLGPYLATGAR